MGFTAPAPRVRSSILEATLLGNAVGAAALNVLAGVMLIDSRQTILPRVAALGLPAIYQFPVVLHWSGARQRHVHLDVAGGLMTRGIT